MSVFEVIRFTSHRSVFTFSLASPVISFLSHWILTAFLTSSNYGLYLRVVGSRLTPHPHHAKRLILRYSDAGRDTTHRDLGAPPETHPRAHPIFRCPHGSTLQARRRPARVEVMAGRDMAPHQSLHPRDISVHTAKLPANRLGPHRGPAVARGPGHRRLLVHVCHVHGLADRAGGHDRLRHTGVE